LSQANDVAILIDGYSMLVHRRTHSLWRVLTDEQQTLAAKDASGPAFLAPHPSHLTLDWYDFPLADKRHDEDDDDDPNGDYADVLSPDYYIDRRHIQISESLGNGQFGEVYRGTLKVNESPSIYSFAVNVFCQADQQVELNIAIKTCKMQDSTTTEAFLEEACELSIRDHSIHAFFRVKMWCKNSIIHTSSNSSESVRNNPCYWLWNWPD
jgi:hypothetical protein